MHYTCIWQYNEALVKITEQFSTHIQEETKIFIGKIVQRFPQNYGHFLKLAADILFNAVEYRAALLIYSYLADKMILFDPLYQAYCYIKLYCPTKAALLLSDMQQYFPQPCAKLCAAKGVMYMSQGSYDKAEGFFVDALQLFGRNLVDYEVFDYRGFPARPTKIERNELLVDFTSLTPQQRLEGTRNITQDTISCLLNLGMLYSRTKKLKLAQLYLEKGCEHATALFGHMASVPLYAHISNALGDTYELLGLHNSARGCYRKAHYVYTTFHGQAAVNDDIALVLRNIAFNHLLRGDKKQACKDMERAIKMYKSIDKNHPSLFVCENFLARNKWRKWEKLAIMVLAVIAAGVILLSPWLVLRGG